MKTTYRFCAGIKFIVFLIASLSAGTAAADDTQGTIFIRAKTGPAFYSNLTPVSSSWGVGLDIGTRWDSGFGVMGMGEINFFASSTDSSNPAADVRTEIPSTRFFGVSPTYSVTQGAATLSFGLGAGVLSVTTQIDTFAKVGGASTSTPETTKSSFAIAPNFYLDFDLVSGLNANIGAQYIVSFGESPQPAMLSPMAGLGYRF